MSFREIPGDGCGVCRQLNKGTEGMLRRVCASCAAPPQPMPKMATCLCPYECANAGGCACHCHDAWRKPTIEQVHGYASRGTVTQQDLAEGRID